jgi:biopolymer transport protein ExbD/biopolymer transport protein TolR
MALIKRTNQMNSDINVTPMADVMLVLLIIFMVITPMLQRGMSVELARTYNPEPMKDADREDAILVAITRDGNIFMQQPTGATKIRADRLTPEVKHLVANRLDKTVYIKSDARAKYKDVVDVVDNVRAAGVDKLGLLTEKIEEAIPSGG